MENIKINYDAMKNICLAELDAFRKLGVCKETEHGPLIYIDRGSNVLGIAHLDSVQSTKHFYVLNIDGGEYVFNAQLDDRLGAYTLLHLLPSLGINCDVLLTYGEEVGKSTAQFFETTKKYKWMFQFDRHGEDVARYMYADEFLDDRLKRAGFNKLDPGMKTDICYLEHLGCMGFNVACGYEDEHSVWASADMQKFSRQVGRFQTFYSKFKGLAFHYVKKPKPTYVYNGPTYYQQPSRVVTTQQSFSTAEGNGMGRTGTEIRLIGGVRYLYDFIYKTYSRCYHQKVQPTDVNFLEDCDICHRPLIISDVYSVVPGICRMCEPYAEECVICNDYFSTKGETTLTYVCPKCKPLGNVLTNQICGNCPSSLYVDEVYDGFCKNCMALHTVLDE